MLRKIMNKDIDKYMNKSIHLNHKTLKVELINDINSSYITFKDILNTPFFSGAKE